ncbi:MAG TPA: DegV family protein, partial [Anaerolineales bacterium]|nr:DegV family protein [Anaerolineales bacterium]
MGKIAVVTDSTAYIPTNLVQQYGITVAPQVLIWGDKTYSDGVDIQPEEFYTRLKSATVMPTTSQVSVVTMQEIFERLIKQGHDVLGVFISSKFSGTMQSAVQGREALGSAAEKVTLVDSQASAMALGFQALAAARAAEAGATIPELKQLVENSRDHVGVVFAVETLEFLHRGGRIGGAARFIGSALNLKPILVLRDGRIEAEDRVRTKSKAVDRVLELVTKAVAGQANIRLATVHANAEAEATELLDRAARIVNPVEKVVTSLSPVVGAHTGPGTVGLA